MAARRLPGVSILGTVMRPTHGIAGAGFLEAVDERLKIGLDKPAAVRAVATERPDLHAAFIVEHNAKIGPSTYRGSSLD